MKSNLKLLALKYLTEEELSGTEIVEKIEEGTDWSPSPGTLYPAMEKLENKGYVKTRKEGRKKIYSITEKGDNRFQDFMEDQEKHWGQVIQGLKNYSEMFDEEELQDFIKHLEKAKDPDFTTPYPLLISYRIMDLLSHYEELEEEDKEEVNQAMEETKEKIERLVKQ